MSENETYSYDLQKELGPANRYDELAGKAQRTGFLFKDLHLVQMGTTLADFIRKYEYNSDKFYLVIAKAKEIENYINLLEKETLCIEDLIITKKDKYYPSQLTLTKQKDRSVIQFGTYKFKGDDKAINDEDIRMIKEIIHSEFPFFSISKEDNIEKRGSADGLGGFNEYKTFKNEDGKPLYEILFRSHEFEGEYGEIYSYFFPTDITDETLIQLLKKIKNYLQGKGLEFKPNPATESKNNSKIERINVLSQGKSLGEFYFNKEIKDLLNQNELEFFLNAVFYTYEKNLDVPDVSLENYLNSYKQIILKIAQEFPGANINEIKENLQKRIRAKKYFIGIKRENDINETFREELNNLSQNLKELCHHDIFSTRFTYEIKYKSNINDLKKQIKTKHRNVEFIDFADKENPGFFLKFNSEKSDKFVIFEIKGYCLNHRKVEQQFFDFFQ
jgi:hypothetical protein